MLFIEYFVIANHLYLCFIDCPQIFPSLFQINRPK